MKELVEAGSPEGINGLSYRKHHTIIHNKSRVQVEDLKFSSFPARLDKIYNPELKKEKG